MQIGRSCVICCCVVTCWVGLGWVGMSVSYCDLLRCACSAHPSIASGPTVSSVILYPYCSARDWMLLLPAPCSLEPSLSLNARP
ncbi:hypothetical protein BKA81DRAFT_360338 [Phyllosticta paracitricarpa]